MANKAERIAAQILGDAEENDEVHFITKGLVAERIAAAIRRAVEEEREECAKIADSAEKVGGSDVIHPSVIADMIRARGKAD